MRVLRVIARLNMGGPAHQAALLSGRRFFPDRYETCLVHGRLAAGEQSLAGEAEAEGADMVRLDSLRQPLQPAADAVALGSLLRLMRRFRPDIVHTHTAKAGMLGRTAAALAPGVRPLLVHTFHGHVLEGYFGPATSTVFKRIERALGRRTDALIGVSQATVDDLVRLGVAPAERFRVVPLGLDLDRFRAADAGLRTRTRRELGVDDDEILCTFVGRIVPIKRVGLLLEATASARRRDPRIRLAVVGDGEIRPELERRAEALGIGDSVAFLGYRAELAPIWAASDLAVLSSANEGTPVSLIEAGAAGIPAVATDVGGVRETLAAEGSVIVPPADCAALAAGVLDFASDADRRHRAGEQARRFALSHFAASQLLTRIDDLYSELLTTSPGSRP